MNVNADNIANSEFHLSSVSKKGKPLILQNAKHYTFDKILLAWDLVCARVGANPGRCGFGEWRACRFCMVQGRLNIVQGRNSAVWTAGLQTVEWCRFLACMVFGAGFFLEAVAG